MKKLIALVACASAALPVLAQRKLEQQPLDPQQQKQLDAGAAVVTQRPGDTAPQQVQGGKPVDRKAAPTKDAQTKPVDPRRNTKPNDPAARNDPTKLRGVAKQMVAMERRHREIIARVQRLWDIYAQQGNPEAVAELDELRRKWNNRYEQAMNGYRDSVGPEIFGKIRAAMGGEIPQIPPPSVVRAPGRGGLDRPEHAPNAGQPPVTPVDGRIPPNQPPNQPVDGQTPPKQQVDGQPPQNPPVDGQPPPEKVDPPKRRRG